MSAVVHRVVCYTPKNAAESAARALGARVAAASGNGAAVSARCATEEETRTAIGVLRNEFGIDFVIDGGVAEDGTLHVEVSGVAAWHVSVVHAPRVYGGNLSVAAERAGYMETMEQLGIMERFGFDDPDGPWGGSSRAMVPAIWDEQDDYRPAQGDYRAHSLPPPLMPGGAFVPPRPDTPSATYVEVTEAEAAVFTAVRDIVRAGISGIVAKTTEDVNVRVIWKLSTDELGRLWCVVRVNGEAVFLTGVYADGAFTLWCAMRERSSAYDRKAIMAQLLRAREAADERHSADLKLIAELRDENDAAIEVAKNLLRKLDAAKKEKEDLNVQLAAANNEINSLTKMLQDVSNSLNNEINSLANMLQDVSNSLQGQLDELRTNHDSANAEKEQALSDLRDLQLLYAAQALSDAATAARLTFGTKRIVDDVYCEGRDPIATGYWVSNRAFAYERGSGTGKSWMLFFFSVELDCYSGELPWDPSPPNTEDIQAACKTPEGGYSGTLPPNYRGPYPPI